MTDTPRRWDRRAAESDPAFEAFAAYLEPGSLRDAYRQRSGKAQATAAPGAWTGWSTKYNWVSRRAAFVEFTVRECQDATQLGLVQIRRRVIDTANRRWCMNRNWPATNPTHRSITYQERTTMAYRARPSG